MSPADTWEISADVRCAWKFKEFNSLPPVTDVDAEVNAALV